MAGGKLILATKGKGSGTVKVYNRRNYVSRPIKSAIQNQVIRMGERRLRDYDLSTAFAVVGNTWVELDASTVAQGDALFNREGRTLHVTSLEINCMLHAVDTTSNTFRIVIALFNGATATPLATSGLLIDNIMTKESCRNYLIKKYVDKYVSVNTTSDPDRPFKYFKKFKKPISIRYGDDTSTYPDKRLMICMISDSGAVTHPYVSTGYSITRFIA